MKALIIVDVQKDFCPGGALATDRGNDVAHAIGQLEFDGPVVVTQDWHIDPGDHFSPTPDYKDTWPVHCVADSPGAELHPALDSVTIDAAFKKGHYSAAYSGFEGNCDGVELADWLRDHDITELDVCGIATDHCVRATVLDALKNGFSVTVLSELCSPVSDQEGALREMEAAGARII